MPRIPTVPGGGGELTTTGSLSPAQVALPFRQLAENIDRFVVIKGRIDAEDQRQRDSVKMSNSLLAAEETLSQLYQNAVESEDFEASGAIFRKSAADAFSLLGQGFSNEEDEAKFALQYGRSVASLDIQIGNRTRRLRLAAHQNTITDLGEQIARSISQLPINDDAGREAKRQVFAEALADGTAAGVITDADKQMENMLETADKDTVNIMSRQNPHELQRLLNQRDEDGKLANFLHLDVPDRKSAHNAAESGIKQQRIVADAAEEDRKFAAERFAIERANAIIPGGPLTELETANLGLGVTKTTALNEMAEDIANNVDLDKDNFEVKNRVGLAMRLGLIENASDFLDEVGPGKLSWDTVSEMIREWEELQNNPEKKAQIKRLAKVIAGFEQIISVNPAIRTVDEAGRENFDEFLFETERLFLEGIEKGLSTDDLLRPSSDHYIINVQIYKRDLPTLMEDGLLSRGINVGELRLDEAGDLVIEEGQRRPNESAEDFLKRTEP